MNCVADLHLHSPYAYASSKDLSLENLSAWARLKGIELLASADFTHPIWFDELRQKLAEAGPGLYRFGEVDFILGTEVSCVYRQDNRQRRVHILLFAPDFNTIAQLNLALARYGNLKSDGRPTLALSARDFTALALDISPDCIIIPAHVWTPWYGLYGSKSGFDRLEQCFLDLTPQIHAVETGLSSDPAMNWQVPELSDKTIVSFSDAHSLPKLGRELTVFESGRSYRDLVDALVHHRVAYTVEFYPEEGKYHYSGHRKCGISQTPEDTQQQGSKCPVCGGPLTLGVLHRVRQLSQDRGDDPAPVRPFRGINGFIHSPEGRPPFLKLVPLPEIISETLGQSLGSKRVQGAYRRMVQELGGELTILTQTSASDLEAVAGERLAQGILRVRRGDIQVDPGYDGLFGRIHLWPEEGPKGATASLQSRLPGL
jgi:uncharacterized protein (TIGR00375 family)